MGPRMAMMGMMVTKLHWAQQDKQQKATNVLVVQAFDRARALLIEIWQHLRRLET